MSAQRLGEHFIAALAAAGANLRKATVEDVQTVLEAMRSKGGRRAGAAGEGQYVHRLGFTASTRRRSSS